MALVFMSVLFVRPPKINITNTSIVGFLFIIFLSLQLQFIDSYKMFSYLAILTILTVSIYAIILNQFSQKYGLSHTLNVTAYSLLISSLIQCILAACQKFDIQLTIGISKLIYNNNFYQFPLLMTSINPERVMGAVAQPNQFAELLFWGIISALHLLQKSKIRPIMYYITCFTLAIFINLTLSRTALLYLVYFIIFGFIIRKYDKITSKHIYLTSLMLGLMFILNKQIIDIFNILSGTQSISFFTRLNATTFDPRYEEMLKAVLIFFKHPVFGVGWEYFAMAFNLMALS